MSERSSKKSGGGGDGSLSGYIIKNLCEELCKRGIGARQVFDEMDHSKDGALDQPEFRKAMKYLIPRISEEEFMSVFKSFDLNSNGFICVKEFCEQLQSGADQCMIEKVLAALVHNGLSAQDLFETVDLTHDGCLNHGELKRAILGLMPDITDVEFEGIYKHFDDDGSGSVTLIEFCEKLGQTARQENEGPQELHFSPQRGYISGGGDLLKATMTVAEAKLKAADLPGCRGFMYADPRPPARGKVDVTFKDKFDCKKSSSAWTCYEVEMKKAARNQRKQPSRERVLIHLACIKTEQDVQKQKHKTRALNKPERCLSADPIGSPSIEDGALGRSHSAEQDAAWRRSHSMDVPKLERSKTGGFFGSIGGKKHKTDPGHEIMEILKKRHTLDDTYCLIKSPSPDGSVSSSSSLARLREGHDTILRQKEEELERLKIELSITKQDSSVHDMLLNRLRESQERVEDLEVEKEQGNSELQQLRHDLEQLRKQVTEAPAIQYLAAPVQYAAAPPALQYSAPTPVAPAIQYLAAPVQYAAAPPALQYSAPTPVVPAIQYLGAPVQYAAAPPAQQYAASPPVAPAAEKPTLVADIVAEKPSANSLAPVTSSAYPTLGVASLSRERAQLVTENALSEVSLRERLGAGTGSICSVRSVVSGSGRVAAVGGGERSPPATAATDLQEAEVARLRRQLDASETRIDSLIRKEAQRDASVAAAGDASAAQVSPPVAGADEGSKRGEQQMLADLENARASNAAAAVAALAGGSSRTSTLGSESPLNSSSALDTLRWRSLTDGSKKSFVSSYSGISSDLLRPPEALRSIAADGVRKKLALASGSVRSRGLTSSRLPLSNAAWDSFPRR